MTKKDFNNISIRGRIAFAIQCAKLYWDSNVQKDFSPIYKKMLDIIGNKYPIDEAANIYMEIIPEYLFEFDTYEESDFEYLSKEDYILFRELLKGTPSDFNLIMQKIYDMVMSYAYTGIEPKAPMVTDRLFEIIDVMDQAKMQLPSIDNYYKYDYSIADGWGNFII